MPDENIEFTLGDPVHVSALKENGHVVAIQVFLRANPLYLVERITRGPEKKILSDWLYATQIQRIIDAPSITV